MANKNKIFIVGPAWVGDMVMAQSLFKLLKQRDPHVIIDVLAPSWSLPLLARMPEVNQAIVMPLAHGQLALKERRRIGKNLRDKGYQQAIVLPNSFKSALIPWWANIPIRTGWLREMRYGLLDGIQHTLERVGEEFGVTRERIRQIEAKVHEKLRQHDKISRLKNYFD